VIEDDVGDHRRGESAGERQDTALSEERRRSDLGLQSERSALDSTLGDLEDASEITDADRRILKELRARIRAQRALIDDRRKRDRVVTDSAIRAERESHGVAMQVLSARLEDVLSTSDLEVATRAAVDAEREIDARGSVEKLWRLLPEIDFIATAANLIRASTCDRPVAVADTVYELASEVEVATERLLELVGDLLDPRDSGVRERKSDASV
jgi:hypothetical protein